MVGTFVILAMASIQIQILPGRHWEDKPIFVHHSPLHEKLTTATQRKTFPFLSILESEWGTFARTYPSITCRTPFLVNCSCEYFRCLKHGDFSWKPSSGFDNLHVNLLHLYNYNNRTSHYGMIPNNINTSSVYTLPSRKTESWTNNWVWCLEKAGPGWQVGLEKTIFWNTECSNDDEQIRCGGETACADTVLLTYVPRHVQDTVLLTYEPDMWRVGIGIKIQNTKSATRIFLIFYEINKSRVSEVPVL